MRRAVQYYPDRIALKQASGALTFRELDQRIRTLVSALVRAGFERGDRLAVLLPNSPEYIELVYACSWLGVVVVPINVRLSKVEIEHVLADSSPRGLVRHSTLPDPSTDVSWKVVLDLEALAREDDTCPDPCYDADAILALIYTSGTTGKPKGVVATHANILANLHHANYWIRYREGGVFLHAAPIFHIADLPGIFAAAAFGACQVTLPRFQPQAFCEVVQNEHVNYTVLVPTMINFLTQFSEAKDYDLNSLQVLAYGGSSIAPEVLRRVRSLLPNLNLIQVYGLSETGYLTGLQNYEHTESRFKSCGRPCPGIEVRVTDPSGNEVKIGQSGELVARGANVMRAYWKNEPETIAASRDGFFRTGDIGYQDADGYFYILDRSKDMIVTGGENVYSGEVESVLMAHPAVREAAVFGVPDAQWGELVVAIVVLRIGATASINDLVQHCRAELANYKIPRRIEFSKTDLPKGGSGKILKRVLRAQMIAHAA